MNPNDIHHKLFDNLQRPLELDSLDRSLWSDKCDYIDPNECANLNPNNHNLIIVKFNIHSILAHQDNLKGLLNNLKNKNSRADIILLNETHLNKHTVGFVNIPNYHHIANYRSEHKGGGTSILLHDSISYRRWKTLRGSMKN